MTPFAITQPGRIRYGRGVAAMAPGLIRAFGERVLVVHGANRDRASWLQIPDAQVQGLPCPSEPTLTMLETAIEQTRGFAPQVVVGLGGGAVLDLAKALAALIPAPDGPMLHLEVAGPGLPLKADPLPLVAIPTTAGTGAEVTRNAVIGLPEHGRKVSLRDDRMVARTALVDPSLTDGCPRGVTLASGLDALTQVIEPFTSCRATPYTDALTRGAVGPGLKALLRLMEAEDPTARDAIAWCSLSGGLALANGGLGAVHGLAGVIGGRTGAAHGAICGLLLGPVLEVNRARTSGPARDRIDAVCAALADGLGGSPDVAPRRLTDWALAAGLPGLSSLGVHPADHPSIAEAALTASSTAANPYPVTQDDLAEMLRLAQSQS
jgi:alcohol dehydrogenase class IV